MGRGDNDRALAAALSLLVSVVLMLLIALVAAAAFAAVAQRRLRQLGMLTAVGATEKHLRLVMVANGVLVGGVAAAGGVVIATAAWIVSRPSFENIVGHTVPIIGAHVVGRRVVRRARRVDRHCRGMVAGARGVTRAGGRSLVRTATASLLCAPFAAVPRSSFSPAASPRFRSASTSTPAARILGR